MFCTSRVWSFKIEELEPTIVFASILIGRSIILLPVTYSKYKGINRYNNKVRSFLVWSNITIKGLRANYVFYEQSIDQKWIKTCVVPMTNIKLLR